MHEWMDIEKNSSRGKRPELDKRLAAYYGPELREQPLSSTSWQRLRSQLNTRHSTRYRQRMRLHDRWHRRNSFVPAYVQETFSRISYEARVSYPQSLLQCSLNTRVHMPTVRVSTLGGLARYLYARKPEHIITRVLMLFAVLLAFTVLLMFWRQNHLVIVFPVVVIPCIPLLLHVQGRRLAFRADSLIVLWLGRERACKGLHALAAHTHRSSRQAWGEPSLVERIRRVCGTRVAVEEECLTLVR